MIINRKGPRATTYQKQGKMLTELNKMYMDNPQMDMDYKMCRSVAKKYNTYFINIDTVVKYAMKPEPITPKDIESFVIENYNECCNYDYRRKSANIISNQLFAREDIVSHKESQPSTTTDVNIIDVRNLVVQFLRNNNLKILKIELRDENTPLITFE